jgi:hypothetical protein
MHLRAVSGVDQREILSRAEAFKAPDVKNSNVVPADVVLWDAEIANSQEY